MLDKIWYEWQLGNPQNVNSFSGGSVQCVDTLQEYQQFPNGCSPDLDVNTSILYQGVRLNLIA